MADHTRLDDGAARARRDEAIGLDAGALAAPEARTVAGGYAAGSRDAAACFLRCGERLRNERPGLLRAGRSDAAWTYAELVVIGHDVTPHGAKRTRKAGRWARSARCAKALHGVERAKNMNKNNRPTDAHRAPFYPAIVRSLRLPPPPAFSMARQSPRGCTLMAGRSWPASRCIARDKQLLALQGRDRIRGRREGWEGVV